MYKSIKDRKKQKITFLDFDESLKYYLCLFVKIIFIKYLINNCYLVHNISFSFINRYDI